MTPVEWIGLLGAVTLLLGTLGAGLKYIISEIIGAYKHQASQTVDAKDAEIARLRDGVTARLDRIEAKQDNLQQDVLALRREGSS